MIFVCLVRKNRPKVAHDIHDAEDKAAGGVEAGNILT